MVFGLLALDDVIAAIYYAFNSLWELDGVRTKEAMAWLAGPGRDFQFPVGIRWCSDIVTA